MKEISSDTILCQRCNCKNEAGSQYCRGCGKEVVYGENEVKEVKNATLPSKNKWFIYYIIIGLIWTPAQKFNKSSIDELIILIVAIGAGFSYYRLKSKMYGNNEIAKIVSTFAILFVSSAFLIGFLTTLADNWKSIAVRTPLGNQVASNDADSLKQIEASYKTYLVNTQAQITEYKSKLDEESISTTVYQNNISNYKAIIKLNDEEYSKTVDFLSQLKVILKTYSNINDPSLSDSIVNFEQADNSITSAEDAVYLAKISLYQSLLINDSKDVIELKFKSVNDTIDSLASIKQKFSSAGQDFQKALDDLFK